MVRISLAEPASRLPGGLVGQDQGRVGGDGPGDGHALLLAAGKLARVMIEPVGQVEGLEDESNVLVAPAGHLPQQYEEPRGFSVLLGLADRSEAERIFHTLAQNGKVQMPLQETFWAGRSTVKEPKAQQAARDGVAAVEELRTRLEFPSGTPGDLGYPRWRPRSPRRHCR